MENKTLTESNILKSEEDLGLEYQIQKFKKNKIGDFDKNHQINLEFQEICSELGKTIPSNFSKLKALLDLYERLEDIAKDEGLLNLISEVKSLYEILRGVEVRYNGIADFIDVLEKNQFVYINDLDIQETIKKQLEDINNITNEISSVLQQGYINTFKMAMV